MVQNVKNLGAKLHVEVLRNAPDMIVLEDGEVQIGDARTDQDISTCIAAQIKTVQIVVRWIAALTIIRGVKCRVGRSGDGKALSFDVVVDVSGIRKGLASGPAKPIRKSPIVVAHGKCRIIPGSPGWRERDAIAHC